MTNRDPELLNLQEFLPYRLSVLTNKVSRTFARLYSERFGLTIPEWRVMAVLGQEPDLSADGVCTRTEMDKVTVSRAVARLVDKGHLKRDVASADRRRSVLRLSRRGYGTYARIIPIAREFERKLMQALQPAELQTLNTLLHKLDERAADLTAER